MVAMSLTLTVTGRSSVLAVNYSPAINVSDDDYELGLMDFETYHTIANVNASNNKFYFGKDDVVITIPEGSYELQVIHKVLKCAILLKRPLCNEKRTVDDDDGEYPLVLRANYNTMKSEIKCAYRINFSKSNNIGSMLDFSNRILQPRSWYELDRPINIINVNIIRVECNITAGTYSNNNIAYTRYMNFHRACHRDIRYRKSLRRSFTCRPSYGALRI